jgi:hypothetical protein
MSGARAVAILAVGLVLGSSQEVGARHVEKPARHRSTASDFGADGLADGACKDGPDATLWVSPAVPIAGTPVRVFGVAATGAPGELSVSFGAGKRAPLPATSRGMAPVSVSAEIAAPRAGSLTLTWSRAGKDLACRRVDVVAHSAKAGEAADAKVVWPSTRRWDARAEDFYAAWIERLFDAPVDGTLEFRPLHVALRDPARNFLAGYLGLGEDDPKNKAAVPATPDCADLPFYLRAYFAWKLALPVGFRDCDRGTDARPPKCTNFYSNEDAPTGKDTKSTLGRVKAFLRQMSNHVQSGSARTALDDASTDYYPVRLERKALRPGVVYADPYGHVMMIVHWVEQTREHGGLLFAVDGQPDTSVGRKRFWEGTFLFTNDTKSAGPGFKAFRPLVHAGADGAGAVEPLANEAIGGAQDPAHAPYSDEQAKLTPDAFYARMGKLINPAGLDPVAAYAETLDALVEQLQVRVGSVDNGEKFMRENANPVVPMPEGAKIFETTGPWEDYATPSRDMRLIIAMNVLVGLPDRVVKHPELFNLGGKKATDARDELRKLHARRVSERGIEYRRSDGSTFKLTVADLLARKAALEIAYNPNDCVETRWGATPGTPEAATCARHTPPDQAARMAEVRGWFHDARRPPR